MHILFLSHYFVPENNAPAARVHAMAREWTRLGHRVTVLTGVPNVPAGVPFEGYANRLFQVEWIDGIRCTDVAGIKASGIDTAEFIRCVCVCVFVCLLCFCVFVAFVFVCFCWLLLH